MSELQPDRRTLRKLARSKSDACEVDGKWWFRVRGTWTRATEMIDLEEGSDDGEDQEE